MRQYHIQMKMNCFLYACWSRSFLYRTNLFSNVANISVVPIKSKLQRPPPPPGKPRAFELLKIGLFKFPRPRAKVVFKCPTLSSDLLVKSALLNNNLHRLLSLQSKIINIQALSAFHICLKSTSQLLKTLFFCKPIAHKCSISSLKLFHLVQTRVYSY